MNQSTKGSTFALDLISGLIKEAFAQASFVFAVLQSAARQKLSLSAMENQQLIADIGRKASHLYDMAKGVSTELVEIKDDAGAFADQSLFALKDGHKKYFVDIGAKLQGEMGKRFIESSTAAMITGDRQFLIGVLTGLESKMSIFSKIAGSLDRAIQDYKARFSDPDKVPDILAQKELLLKVEILLAEAQIELTQAETDAFSAMMVVTAVMATQEGNSFYGVEFLDDVLAVTQTPETA